MDRPGESALRWMVQEYARLRAAYGEAIGVPALVQPTEAFFPDEFQADAASVSRLLQRMIGYAPIADDLPLELAFVAGDGEGKSGGCGSAACGSTGSPRERAGRVEESGDGYRILLAASDVGHPDLLTASLARGIGALVLHEAGAERLSDALAELSAVACGFGVLLVNGAAVWGKSCGGLRMTRATVLSVEELAVALSLYAFVHGVSESKAREHLPATQREAFDQAAAWTASNLPLVEALRDRPDSVAGGLFDLEPARGPLGRWFHQRKRERAMRAGPAAPRPPLTDQQKRRLEEARLLVDEVFGGE